MHKLAATTLNLHLILASTLLRELLAFLDCLGGVLQAYGVVTVALKKQDIDAATTARNEGFLPATVDFVVADHAAVVHERVNEGWRWNEAIPL